MIRHTVRVSELRLGEDAAGAGDKPPYNAACTLFWSFCQKEVEVSALNGSLSRARLRELLAKLRHLGILRVIADRAASHVLPMARRRHDGKYEMQVDELCDRFMPAGDTDWMPLPDE